MDFGAAPDAEPAEGSAEEAAREGVMPGPAALTSGSDDEGVMEDAADYAGVKAEEPAAEIPEAHTEPSASYNEEAPVAGGRASSEKTKTPSSGKTKTARISRQADEPGTITIRKKPGRKEKEKVWKSEAQPKRGRKSLKEIAAEADLIEIPADEILFSKQYYSIGDVANMFRMNPTLIRTWSNEFEQLLQPKKNKKGDRYFRPLDVKTLHLIYHLIRVRKFTLEGAKEHLKSQKKKTENHFAVIRSLDAFKAFLLELKQNL
ncbi:MAG: MerR family transcriptional regulator [Flavihumibacter sp.]